MLGAVMIMTFCWCFQSWDLFKRIILGKKKENPLSYLPWVVGIPLVCCIVLAVQGSFVYELGKINCDLWAKNPELEFFLGWLPFTIAVFFGIYFTIAIAVKIVYLYNTKVNDGNSNIWQVIKMLNTALKYIFAFGLFLGGMMLVALASGNGDSSTDEGLDRIWGACVFEHFDGVSDESFVSHCGRSPEHTVSFEMLCFFQFYQFGMHGIFFAAVYWKSLKDIYLRAFWPKWYRSQIKPAYADVGELPVSASSAMPKNAFAGLKTIELSSGPLREIPDLSEAPISSAPYRGENLSTEQPNYESIAPLEIVSDGTEAL